MAEIEHSASILQEGASFTKSPEEREHIVQYIQNSLYIQQASSGDFTTVEMNAIERTLYNSCSQSLARKRDSLKKVFSKHFSSG